MQSHRSKVSTTNLFHSERACRRYKDITKEIVDRRRKAYLEFMEKERKRLEQEEENRIKEKVLLGNIGESSESTMQSGSSGSYDEYDSESGSYDSEYDDEEIEAGEVPELDKDLVFNVRYGNQLFTRLLIAEYCSLFFAVFGLILSILVYEKRFIAQQNGESISQKTTLLQNMTCTFCLAFSIYIRYDIWLEWSKSI